MAQELENVEKGLVDRLMILMPPRHGKSELSSIRFPAWYLGRNPDKRIISMSYSADLASEFGRKTRDLVENPLYGLVFPNVSINKNTRAVNAWDLTADGGYRGVGAQGGATGKGAHLFLIDDPIKNIEEAESEVYRAKLFKTFQAVAYTRLEDAGAIILIMTPWHKDDLAHRLLQAEKDGGDKWRVVKFPALATEDEQFRSKGEALWHGKYNESDLHRIKRNIGSRYWDALYQQNPTSEEGGIFKRAWWNYYRELPKYQARTIQVWDTAQKDKTQNDYNVCTTWVEGDKYYHLVDVFRERMGYPELKRKALQLADKYKPNAILIEDKASGISLIQDFQADSKLPVIPIPVNAGDDKVVRANTVSAFVEAGNVAILEGAHWVNDFIDELADFPNAKHDDQVDSAVHALRWFAQGAGVWTGDMTQGSSILNEQSGDGTDWHD